MSSHNDSHRMIPTLPPVLTVTPATLPSFQNLPPTPISLASVPTSPCIKSSCRASPVAIPTSSIVTDSMDKAEADPSPSTPKSMSTYTGQVKPNGGVVPICFPSVYDQSPSLLVPLSRHLRMMHPQTPKEIIDFVALRLLSPERPYGHKGPWKPVCQAAAPAWASNGTNDGVDAGGQAETDAGGLRLDLSAAGLGLEARKGYEQLDEEAGGKGKEMDKMLEGMYTIARDSWRRLDEIAPTGGRVPASSESDDS